MWVITFTIWNYSRGDNLGCRVCMNSLVIKEDMCTKSSKDIAFTNSPKKKSLINMYIPFS